MLKGLVSPDNEQVLMLDGRVTIGRADGIGRDPIEHCLDYRNDRDFGVGRPGDSEVDRTDGEGK